MAVETIATPGALRSIAGPRLLKHAKPSSRLTDVSEQVYEPLPKPPGRPSKSESAETVMTSGYVAGM
jgi:hypothetical protein